MTAMKSDLPVCCAELVAKYEAIWPGETVRGTLRSGIALFCKECFSRVVRLDGGWRRDISDGWHQDTPNVDPR